MEEQILDYFGEFEQQYQGSKKIITVKYFFYESQARVYAAKLNESDIPCFISNANSITAFPLGGGGIGLHVIESNSTKALQLIKEMDEANKQNIEEDFSEADKEDIEYQKSLHEKKTNYKPLLLAVLVIIILVLVRSFLIVTGIVNWDFI